MLKKILIVIAIVIGLILVIAAVQSPDYKISRSVVINAPADVVFPYINNSQKLNDWMPWAAMDPSVQFATSGPAEGVGSVSSWKSTGDMGDGSATIIESVPPQLVRTKIEYTRPMNMTQVSEMNLVPEDTGTKLTWTVTGQNSFIGRVFCLFMNMDKTVGGAFEQGLNKLKATIEK